MTSTRIRSAHENLANAVYHIRQLGSRIEAMRHQIGERPTRQQEQAIEAMAAEIESLNRRTLYALNGGWDRLTYKD